jgi:GntR family transcriptional regulator
MMSYEYNYPMLSPSRSRKSVSLDVRDAILDMIARRNLKAGDQLPSEADLTLEFNISRPTVREAMRLLEQDGLILTQHGRGRFLSAAATLRVERPITAYESITSLLHELGHQPKTEVISVKTDIADRDTAVALRCGKAVPVLVIERMRVQEAQALVYSLEIVPRQYFPGSPDDFDFHGSLNDLLGQQGYRPRMSSAAVSAVELPVSAPPVARGTYRGPWLLITETCFTEDGTPVLFARDYHRGDIFSFNFSRR